MVEQHFVGDKPVDSLPAEATQKISDEQLTQAEVQRNAAEQPGAGKRAGAATRDPKEFDTAGRGGQGNTQPQADPVV